MRNVLTFFPEICITLITAYLAFESIYAAITSGSGILNYVIAGIFILLLAGIIAQFYWRNIIVSTIYSLLYGIGSLYMILAVLSEYSEFPAGDPNRFTLLIVGTLLFGGLGVLCIIMPWKYKKLQTE